MSRFDPGDLAFEPPRQAASNQRFRRRGRVVAAVRKYGDRAVALVSGTHVVLVLDVDTAVAVADALVDAVEAAQRAALDETGATDQRQAS